MNPIFIRVVLCCICALLPRLADAANEGRLISTGGLLGAEGQAGGGLVPWAVTAGLSTKPGWDWVAAITTFDSGDYEFKQFAVAASFNDRFEISLARQSLGLDFDLPAGLPHTIDQTVFGAKYLFAGDLIYSKFPAMSVGMQYKINHDADLAHALGAVDDRDVDFFLSASKLWLDGPFHRNFLLNGTLRATRANELGFLGFAGNDDNQYDLMFEVSAALFLNPKWALGAEYRQKPNNLEGLSESDWRDVFVAWFPNKSINLAMAWLEMGKVANRANQDALYLTVNGNF